ncbi:MAG: transglycosylase SLT domain-containing protein [Holosporales bacterium]|jgi:soluble lytic murein transglycosylase|nr:transglycosylase SLT domain-containing protein [Holosporales bacterium]
MLYVKIFKKSIFPIFFRSFFLIIIFSSNVSQATLTEIEKFEKWQEAIKNPKDYKKVFLFFYNNPHWPLFKESIKTAEKNVDPNIPNKIVLKWFKKYPPKTPEGIKIYSKILLKTSPKEAREYIEQTWIFQNLPNKFAKEYRNEFKEYLTEIEDAKRAKHLISAKRLPQLKDMQNYAAAEVSEYIAKYLKSLNARLGKKDIHDPASRYHLIQNYIEKNDMKNAANILAQTNEEEESDAYNFFTQRRHVGCNILRAGNPKLAYDVLKMNKLNRNKQKEEYAKAEWLMGFISYRFLKDYPKAKKHFENGYEHCKNPIRRSKSAFWMAEVCRSAKDVLFALEWYRKAEQHFNTFYGYLAHYRLLDLAKGRFSLVDNFYEGEKEYVPMEFEVTFNNRELVRVLIALAKSNKDIDKTLLLHFYNQLIDEIEDPREEVLILNLASSDDEVRHIISAASDKQLYFNNKKVYKMLDPSEREIILQINPDPCFIALVHAIIHRESNFKQDARSYVGAVGLMQIMPATAEYEAKNIKFYLGNVSLFNRRKNLIIGSSIINRLLKKYKADLSLAIPAYNCGEGNMAKYKKKISKLKNLSYLDKIELIPYKESRIYTKYVLRGYFIYQKLFKAENCYNCSKIVDLE